MAIQERLEYTEQNNAIYVIRVILIVLYTFFQVSHNMDVNAVE